MLPQWLAAWAVAAVLLAAAWPGLSGWAVQRRLETAAQQTVLLLSSARSEAVRLNLPVYVCPVQIRSDGNPNAYCRPAYRLQGLASWADSDADGFYRRGTDIALRSVAFLQGVEEFSLRPFSSSCRPLDDGARMPAFLPDGRLVWAAWAAGKTNGARFSDGLIRLHLAAGTRSTVVWLDAGGSVSAACAQEEL
ncbi:GspH/FimT family pseudopilin [Neisseria leonii]|uniref:GspH/FimT family pseudopilin n=1 Tax=Neisseria leonii TaxID=2995413 RepID=UPI00237A7C89|nr:GspH/FimT family pseudopilin [Neisseria sp. 3986]MDD9326090.1 GspH/FimT family pseudopilin [Neisseria sp. 3986]